MPHTRVSVLLKSTGWQAAARL